MKKNNFTAQLITTIVFIIFLFHVTGIKYQNVIRLASGFAVIVRNKEKPKPVNPNDTNPESNKKQQEEHQKKEADKRQSTDRHKKNNENGKSSGSSLFDNPDFRTVSNEVNNGQNCGRALSEYDTDCQIQSDPIDAFEGEE